MPLQYDWNPEIAPQLNSITAVEGGFTPAERGIITLENGANVFVKIANDPNTRKWLKKEIKVYRLLNNAGYEYIPQLLAVNEDETAMAIEYLDGASFEHSWDKDKLEAVVAAQETLKQYIDLFRNDADFNSDDVIDHSVKWPAILEGENLEVINRKLKKLGGSETLSRPSAQAYAKLNDGWSPEEDTLIHEDIRADNFGYDPKTKTGKLIDWNWLCIGDASLDTTPLFINMRQAGFDPYAHHPEKFDRPMIAYLLSYWLDSILEGNEDSSPREWKLRTAQTKSVDECLRLLEESSKS